MVGECEIHYLEQPSIAYLRRIFVKEELQKKRFVREGISRSFLYRKITLS